MVIHKSGGFKRGGLNRKLKCLECNKPSKVFFVSPSSRKRLCKACAGPQWPEWLDDEVDDGSQAPSAD